MAKTYLSQKKVISSARKIVREAPKGYRHEGKCLYRDNATNEPICLVGRIFHDLGLPLSNLNGSNKLPLSSIHLDQLEIEMHPKTFDFLLTLQSHQDKRRRWSYCLYMALGVFKPQTKN